MYESRTSTLLYCTLRDSPLLLCLGSSTLSLSSSSLSLSLSLLLTSLSSLFSISSSLQIFSLPSLYRTPLPSSLSLQEYSTRTSSSLSYDPPLLHIELWTTVSDNESHLSSPLPPSFSLLSLLAPFRAPLALALSLPPQPAPPHLPLLSSVGLPPAQS